MSIIKELKRRNVFKVAIAYLVASWLLLQLTEVLTELLELNTDIGKIVIVLLIVGFVPALIFAWAFEMTPEGIKRDHEVDRDQSIAPHTGHKLNFAIIGMLILVAGYFIWESRFAAKPAMPATSDTAADLTQPEPEGTAPLADERIAIVVLPFVNMSADPEQEFFSDGLSEEILNALAQVKELRVISRTSAFAFKGKDMAIPQIAEQLDVSHVLEGSVRSAGDSVRITAQLIEVDTDSHLWSQAYNRKLENIFEIQENISVAIAEALQVTLSEPAETDNRPTTNLAAYEAFLRGRHLYQQRGEMGAAIDFLESAITLDPAYAEAWANLAAAQAVQSYFLESGYREMKDRSRASAEKAIELDPENGFGHAVLGLLHSADLNHAAAIEAINTAIRLNPNESNSYLWLAITQSSLGYIEQAIETLSRAEQIDPVFINLHNWFVNLYLMSGELELARKHYDIALNLNPDWVFNNQGDLDLADGDIDKAERQSLEAFQSSPSLQAILKAYYEALRDPSMTEAFVTMDKEIDPDEQLGSAILFFDSAPYLFKLGEVGAALDVSREVLSKGRGLRAVIGLGMVWLASNRDKLADPALIPFFEETGLTDYWRKHGDPDYCRVTDDGVECVTE